MKQNLLIKRLLLYAVCIFCSFKLQATVNITGNVSGTWTKANSPYIISGTVTVPAGQKLIIQPGVEVRSLRYDDEFEVDGSLYAVGTLIDTIRFNGFANPGVGASSTHGGLFFVNSAAAKDSTVMGYVAMDRWGDKDYWSGDQAAIEVGTGTFIIRNSRISNCEAIGIYGKGELTVNPIIAGVVFANNPVPALFYTDNVGGLTACTGAVVTLRGSSFSRNSVIPKAGSNSWYVLEKGSSHQFSNCKLTIQPGVEIRSMSYVDYIGVDGTGVLSAKGTATDSIWFKGFADATTPGSSHGGLLFINSSSTTDSSVLAYVSMDRWGDKDYWSGDQAAIELGSGTFIMRNSRISNSEATGIYGKNELATNPVISGVVFTNNPVPVRLYTDNVGGVSNCANAIITLQGNSFTRASTIPKPGPGSYYILDKGSTHTFTDCKLTILPGVEIRSMNFADNINIQGTGIISAKGTATDSIWFKGFADASAPGSSHGGLLFINSTSPTDSSVFYYVNMDRWGDKDYWSGDQAAIELGSGAFIMRNSRISNSELRAINGYNDLAATPVISNVVFNNNPVPMRLYTDNVGGIANCTNAIITLLGNNFAKASTIPKPGPGSYYMLDKGSTHTFTDCKLTIQPGVEIRSNSFSDYINVQGNGVISAKGTATDSIFFKGFADLATPGSTHGGLLYINSSSTTDSTVFAYISMDRWGDKDYWSGDQAAIEVGNGTVVIRNSRISNSEVRAINGYNDLAVTPVINGVVFVNNPVPVRLYTDNVGNIANCTNAVITLLGNNFTKASTISKPGTGSYYILDKASTHTFTDCKLTIQPGVEIRSMSFADYINIQGKGVLSAKGTATDSIWFKGYADATTSGSTHGGLLYINSSSTVDSSVLSYVAIDRWGDKDYWSGDQAALELGSGKLRITNSSIRNSEVNGIYGSGDATGLTVLKTNIFNNQYGAVFNSGKPSITRSNIYNNKVFGINNVSGVTLDTVEARNNWWGDSTGPKQTVTNTNGKGNAVSLKVRYKPWLTRAYQNDDIGATLLLSPVTGCSLTNAETVRVRLKNYGSRLQTAFNISYRINNGTVVTESVGALSVASDSTADFAFATKADLSTPGATYTIKVFTALTADTIKINDTAFATVINQKPNLGKDSTVKICAGSYTNIKNLYNTTSYIQPVLWSTARPDSVYAGTYTLIVTNSFGCKDTAGITVGTNPKPNLGKDTLIKICAGSYTTIKTLYDTTGYKPNWSTTRPDSVYAGTYSLIVTNSYGCKDTAGITVGTNPKPNLGKDTTVKICTGTLTTIRALYDTTGYALVKWSVANPGSVGKGTYSLIVTNTTGCKDTANIKVDTLPSPAKPVLTKTGNLSFCVGDSLLLSTTSTGTLQWFRNNAAIKKATANRYAVKLSGNYKLQVSNAGSCAVFSDSVIAVGTQLTKPTITMLNDSLISSAAAGNQWFESGALIAGAIKQKYSPDNIDVYTVQYATGACKSPMSDPYYYTANTNKVKITDGHGMQAHMYPNPAVNETNILVTGTGTKILVTVTDLTGKTVLQTTGLYNVAIRLPIAGLAQGVYIVTVNDGKQIKVTKLIKQ